MIRVLLVDDQEMIRSGLKMLINSEADLQVVGEADSVAAAASAAIDLAPDVVVMDVRLGADESGVDAAAAMLGEDQFEGGVLMLTTFDDDDAVASAFKIGVSGFLLKQSDSEELLRAIRTVGHGGVAVDQAIVKRLMSAYPGEIADKIGDSPAESGGARNPSPLDVLTPRETEVVELIAEGKSNAEIAQDLVLSLPTVKSHVRNILFKLGVRDRLQAALLVQQRN